MKILFLGGTGIISTACTELAVARGHDIFILNRGTQPLPAGAQSLVADLADDAAVTAALGEQTWDAVVDFKSYAPADLERRVKWFTGRTGHFLFISSASAYQKPPEHYLIREATTPLENPFWQYSRDKIACEEYLNRQYAETGFPVTNIRPSLTYGDTQIPLAFNSWQQPYTAIDRLRRGLPIIIPGDGRGLWTVTHNSDFAKALLSLLGNPATLGEAIHITSDEVMTWNQYYALTAAAAGVDHPEFVHIPGEFISSCLPDELPGLLGDKLCVSVFDNSKVKGLVPDFVCKTPYPAGIAKTLAWFDADPKRQQVDATASAHWDKLIAAYRHATAAGLDHFASL